MSTGTSVSVAEAVLVRREPTTLTLGMPSGPTPVAAFWANAAGVTAARLALPYRASKTD
ncbi:MAG: hypothetical protein ABIT83_05885 [Massilia sp.]